ncbi:hypothetical protein CHLNCDRAFT_137591 [Chlorella variabilis]|uniref:UVR domain-containing protein n=1 Tax=Chlorella variabilis TaxID=554065 RepID=E1Z416_CHLVA|nr:hypothetical protein CHLNCDRAFT_137591 [Chlorella variabilis]EFN58975.1 hypothetical protein CHLNCDRAFT_137591 [Chlorella variabilis]|eukprot:XP_005851077.1 hypothetical protein CHLNCDRAFT_137591 [Chlorella variabilis]
MRCRQPGQPLQQSAAHGATLRGGSLPRSGRRRGWRCRGGVDDKVLYTEELPLSKLQQQLDQVIDDEDYEAAAQLRDVIQRRRFDSRLAVEEANERFYKAFQSGSLAAMSEVWGKGEHVQCIHPLCGCIAGRQAVMESWKAILGSARMRIEVEDVRIFASDSQAFVTCLELTESGQNRGRIAATNVFEKQGGVWKLVHHHGSPMPPGAR